MNFNVNDLPASCSHYDGHNTFYYRGDGVRKMVILPEGKDVVHIQCPDGMTGGVVKIDAGIFVFSGVIPNGELVTITLKDAE